MRWCIIREREVDRSITCVTVIWLPILIENTTLRKHTQIKKYEIQNRAQGNIQKGQPAIIVMLPNPAIGNITAKRNKSGVTRRNITLPSGAMLDNYQ